MIDPTFPVKLQIISLQLGQKYDFSLQFSISLMKGMQSFGQFQFKIPKYTAFYQFQNKRTIDFVYTKRSMKRNDVFFQIILTNLQSHQQQGSIKISTNKMIQFFQNEPDGVLELSDQFIEGIFLQYKLYQPEKIAYQPQITISFKNSQKNDFLSNLFEYDEQINNSLNVTRSRIRKSSFSINNNNPASDNSINLGQNVNNKNDQSSRTSIKMTQSLLDPVNLSRPILQSQQLNYDENMEGSKNKFMQISNVYHSKDSQQAELISRINKFDQGFIQNPQKLTISKGKAHHSKHGLSKKLKAVIILLILGFLVLVGETLSDKSHRKKSQKKSKIHSQKKKKISDL